MIDLQAIGRGAKEASYALATAKTADKNRALQKMAAALIDARDEILAANAQDIASARKNGMRETMIDRLLLTDLRIRAMAAGIQSVCDLPDPVGRVLSGGTLDSGLCMEKRTVPLGVIAIIFESRPNVAADAAALCLKSGNACILRGGKEALLSNAAIVRALRGALGETGFDENCVSFIDDPGRETATALMRLNEFVDCLIPRGGAGLIRSVVENATVPVIETGVGNCHAYVEKTADIAMAAEVIDNAKTSRPSVCNALETLLVDEEIASAALKAIAEALNKKQVEIRGCEKTRQILPYALPATDEDYATEFLDLVLAVKVVSGIDEAIAHIRKYSTHHSETIITRDLSCARRFTNEVDSAAVYVNASTRFTDGGMFGLGAEIGISTQKLHARGPMGLEAMTSYKYVLFGDGQVRL